MPAGNLSQAAPKHRSTAAIIGLCAAGIAVIGLVLVGCISVISKELETSLDQFVAEVIEVEGSTVDGIIDGKLSVLHGASAFVTEGNIADEGALMDHFREIVDSGAFTRMGIIGLDGTGMGYDADLGALPARSYADRAYFQAALQGADYVSDPIPDAWADGESGVVYAVPIYDIKHTGGDPIGVLVGTEPTEALSAAIDASLFEGNGYVHIIDSEGNLLFRSERGSTGAYTNVFDMPYDQAEGLGEMQANLARGTGGSVSFTHTGDIPKVAAYEPIDVNDWFVEVVLPADYLQAKNRTVLLASIGMAAFIVAVVALLMAVIFKLRHRGEQALARAGLTDRLTGLDNAAGFTRALARRPGAFDGTHSLVLVNLIGFSLFNTIFGYEAGSQFLKEVARMLSEGKGCDGLAARLAGDRFLLLVSSDGPDTAEERLHGILQRIDQAAESGESQYRVVSQCCIYRLGTADADRDVNLIIQDMAVPLRKAKSHAGSRVVSYNEHDVEQAKRTRQIESIMSTALIQEEFVAYFQPQYDIRGDKPVLCGAEALVRWMSPVLGMVRPDEFIPVFEENGFVDRIDRYMLERACIRLRQWADEGMACVPVSVNLSRRNLFSSDLAERIGSTVDGYGIPRSLIKLELTESILSESDDQVSDAVRELQAHGFKVSMDDFGSGYSTLPMLRRAPFDAVKLDRSFFGDSFGSERGRSILVAIIDMLNRMGFETVAEGIEDAREVAQLKAWGCHVIQGYAFGRPAPADEFARQHLRPAQDGLG